MLCDEEEVAKHQGDVSSVTNFNNVLKSLDLAECTEGWTNSNYADNVNVPNFAVSNYETPSDGKAIWCALSSGTKEANDCAAVTYPVKDGGNPQRLCWCSAHASPPPPPPTYLRVKAQIATAYNNDPKFFHFNGITAENYNGHGVNKEVPLTMVNCLTQYGGATNHMLQVTGSGSCNALTDGNWNTCYYTNTNNEPFVWFDLEVPGGEKVNKVTIYGVGCPQKYDTIRRYSICASTTEGNECVGADQGHHLRR